MIRQRFTFFSLLFLLLVSACSQVGSPAVEEGPTITDFSASPLNADGSATLSWRVEDATSLSIDQGIGDVTGQSSASVSPTQTTTYTLRASNSEGVSSAQATVTVSGASPNPEPETCTSPVAIPDERLEDAVREQLGKPEGELTCEDLATLSELSYGGDIEFGPTIENLEGLQYAVNLESLRLYETAPDDYSPIANLTKLETLDLEDSSRGDLSFLTNLTSLVELDLSSYLFGNGIEDITPLQNLKKLEKLNLAGFYEIGLPSGRIEDIRPLEGLTNLTELDLGGQPVTDLSPLVANSGLGEGDKVALGGAQGGGLDDVCYDETFGADVETLRERGVDVDTNFDDYPTCKSEPDGDGNITVTSTSGAASLEDDCTLRAAITAANTDSAVGGCPAGEGADTVVLAEGATYTLSEVDNGVDDATAGPSGLPRISSEIGIEGNGATIERSDAEDTPFFRLFYVADTGDLEVENATVRRGMLDISNSGEPTILGPNLLNLGALTLTDVVVSEGSLDYSQAGEGAVSLHNSGTLIMTRSEVKNNGFSFGTFSIFNAGEATITESSVRSDARDPDLSSPGAIYNAEPGKLTLERSSVTGHYTFGTTAGIENDGQTIIVDSAVTNNSSDQGDGGLVNSGVMEIERSLIADNGGGDGGTGGIFNEGKLTLLSSTMSSNGSEFEFSGGAIYNSDGATFDVRYSTIKDNSTGDDNPDDDLSDNAILNGGVMTFRGAILENSSVNCEGSGTFISEGYNLDSDGSCNLNQSTDSNVDAKLGELKDNGGPTPTHALQGGSPAIDAIPTNACEVDTDQRGVSRPQGDACDVGAFELEQ